MIIGFQAESPSVRDFLNHLLLSRPVRQREPYTQNRTCRRRRRGTRARARRCAADAAWASARSGDPPRSRRAPLFHVHEEANSPTDSRPKSGKHYVRSTRIPRSLSIVVASDQSRMSACTYHETDVPLGNSSKVVVSGNIEPSSL